VSVAFTMYFERRKKRRTPAPATGTA
jgi:hypothetical protein